MIPPPGVPASAFWDPEREEWRRKTGVEAVDASASASEESWWPSGVPKATVVAPTRTRVATASFRFHPDGSLFRSGPLLDGVPHGTHRAYRTAGVTPERLQPCCVPDGAWQLVQTFDRGALGELRWFDRDGFRLLNSGERFPEHPDQVPAEARFNEHLRLWEAGVSFETATPTGTRRRWDTSGVLRSEEDLREGKWDGRVRLFDPAGGLIRDAHYIAGGLEGPFREPRLPVPYYREVGIAGHEGQFEDGQAVGLWRYLGEDGDAVGERDLGRPVPRDLGPTTCAALEDGCRAAEEWSALARDLEGEGRVAEALLAAARAAAAGGAAGELHTALDRLTMPLHEEKAEEEARRALESQDDDLVTLLDGLRRGAGPGALLLGLGRRIQGADRAALDLIDAALLLDPGSTDALMSRALTLGALGDPAGARAELNRIAPLSPEGAQFLDLYLRVYFPRFDFWPGQENWKENPEEKVNGSPAGLDADFAGVLPARDVEEVRDTLQRLATRLMWTRDRLRQQVPDDAPFMLPELSSRFLPEGPVALRQWTYSMSAAEYSGDEPSNEAPPAAPELGEPVDIVVDESIGLSRGPRSPILELMRRARADWAALTWLCFAVGLDEPRLPERIAPPRVFGRSAVMIMERTWRVHDRIASSGLRALTKGIRGFDWVGTPIDMVPGILARVALEEYLEVRAIFAWLCDPANQSPWQDDLRRVLDP